MDEALEKISRKIYYALMYPDMDYFVALSHETGCPYKVDDISLAWLRREPHEFQDFCILYPELDLSIVRISFNIEQYEED